MMATTKSGICAPKGFLAAGVYSGIKDNPFSKDLGLVFSEAPATAAGVFTTNKIKAACIVVSSAHLKDNRAQAIIVNSGNANCCTGSQGLEDARQMAVVTARALGIKTKDVLVASTGVIGRPLAMGKIINAIPRLARRLGIKGSLDAARAIMTTDTIEKQYAVRFKLGRKNVTVGGIAKGAGMICPDMATMLGFITTDIAIASQALGAALKDCVARSFNCISVDGQMSTNDMVLVLANGAAQNKTVTLKTKDAFEKFNNGLFEVTKSLAKMIVIDGEGATKLLEVSVTGARTKQDARTIAGAVCNSILVKTALYGQDPNWGRIAAAAGASKAYIQPGRLSIYFGKTKVLGNGKPVSTDDKILKNILKGKEIKITVDVGVGNSKATMWTCDLSEGYIRINAKYRT